MNEKKLSPKEILDKLSQVEFESHTRDYELYVAKISDEMLLPTENKIYLDEMNRLIASNQLDLAFSIFYALCTYHRRHYNITENAELIRVYRCHFKDYSAYKFLDHLSQKANPFILQKDVLDFAEDMVNDEKLIENNGVMHSFCETVAEYLEEDLSNLTEKEYLLEKAIEDVRKITISERYAKYFCTYGRLLILQAFLHIDQKDAKEKLTRGISQISKAIDIEDPDTKSYSLKVSQYQMYIDSSKNQFKSMMLENEIHRATADMEEKTAELNVKNMEFLAFFIGVISFTLGSLNLTGFDNFGDNARLIVVLMGALMVAFSCFGFILYGFEKKNRIYSNMAVLLVGFLLLFLAPNFYR